MELRFVVPNMEMTFGNLEFAGENTTEQQRINGRIAVINRSYNLYSDVQRADDVVVTLPAKAGEKHFSPEQKVKLINPRITTDGYKIGERGFVNYILLADDMFALWIRKQTRNGATGNYLSAGRGSSGKTESR